MSFSTQQLEEIEQILQNKESLLEGRENMLESRITLEDRFGRDRLMNNSTIKDNDIYTTDHIRDISSDRTRPSLGNAALTDVNPHLSELSNHELHQIKKMYSKNLSENKETIFEQSLGDIIDKTINFASYSYENYTKSMYSAELSFKKELKDSTLFEKIYLYISALTIMLKTDKNMIYMGIILIFFSNIIYFISILI
jgi:hypothetical protein